MKQEIICRDCQRPVTLSYDRYEGVQAQCGCRSRSIPTVFIEDEFEKPDYVEQWKKWKVSGGG